MAKYVEHHLVAFIAPNKTVAESMQESLKGLTESGNAIVYIIHMDDLWGDIAQLKVKGVTALVARGGTYRELEALHQDIPLVRARIVTTDVLYAMQRAIRLYPRRPYYLILNKEADFVEDICRTALPEYFECIRFEGLAGLQNALRRVPSALNPVIIGSGLAEIQSPTPATLVDITMRSSTLNIYYRQAVSLVTQIRRNERQRAQMQSLFSTIEDGLIVLNSQGQIRQANPAFLSLLNANKSTALNAHIHEIFPNFPYTTLLGKKTNAPVHRLVSLGNQVIDLSFSTLSSDDSVPTYLLVARNLRTKLLRENITKMRPHGNYQSVTATFDQLQTISPDMQQLLSHAKAIAARSSPVLIEGEEGTGRLLLAEAIHNASARKDAVFIAVSLSTLDPSEQERALFGHVSPTPQESTVGLLELANGGTLCIFDIDCLHADLQSRLLHYCEAKILSRNRLLSIPVDVRLITVSESALWQKVSQGTFLKALYTHISDTLLQVPPLRNRTPDIPFLFQHFLKQRNFAVERVPAGFLSTLEQAYWPGNVQQLKRFAHKYVLQQGKLSLSEIPNLRGNSNSIYPLLPIATHNLTPDSKIDLHQINQQVERVIIEALLSQNFKKNEIAQMFGISRQALYKKMSAWTQEN